MKLAQASAARPPRRARMVAPSFFLVLTVSIFSAIGFDQATAAAADGPSFAEAGSDSARLVTRAREMGLARSLEWQRLVHYRPDPWGNPVSEVDGQEFFLARAGKHDPEAELE